MGATNTAINTLRFLDDSTPNDKAYQDIANAFEELEGQVEAIEGQVSTIEDILPNNAGSKNSRYRGKFLGTSYTTEQQQAIASGTFEGLEIGDYWTIGGINWRIAGFNYYLRSGDTQLTTNHITIVPDTTLYNHSMNDTNTTTGGYTGSKMYTNGLEQAKTIINNAFPNRVLQHRQILCNAVAEGKARGCAWYDSTVELMCENMIYGANVFGDSNLGGGGGYNVGLGKSQLPLFLFRPDLVGIRQAFWLRDVVSDTRFAVVNGSGVAAVSLASGANGVRPAFSIYYEELKKLLSVETYYNLDPVRESVLIDLIFNMGRPRLSKFKKMLKAIEERDYLRASLELEDSLYFRQTGQRARDNVRKMREGH